MWSSFQRVRTKYYYYYNRYDVVNPRRNIIWFRVDVFKRSYVKGNTFFVVIRLFRIYYYQRRVSWYFCIYFFLSSQQRLQWTTVERIAKNVIIHYVFSVNIGALTIVLLTTYSWIEIIIRVDHYSAERCTIYNIFKWAVQKIF